MEKKKMNLQPAYQDHTGMMIKILGYDEVVNEGEAVEPFLKAVKTHDPEQGQFSTWLWHNLQQKKRFEKKKKKVEFVPESELAELSGGTQPEQIAEFRDELRHLSDDAKALVNCLLCETNRTTRRTKWADSSMGTAREVRKQLKEHCRETLMWSWPRYWKAVNEIKDMLR
jgi:hypothetical protein